MNSVTYISKAREILQSLTYKVIVKTMKDLSNFVVWHSAELYAFNA